MFDYWIILKNVGVYKSPPWFNKKEAQNKTLFTFRFRKKSL